MRRFLMVLPLVVLAFGACRSKPQVRLPLYDMKFWEKSDRPCDSNRQNCSYLKFQYPEFTQAPSPQAKEAFNKLVQSFLLEPIFQKKSDSLDALARDFFSEHEKLIKEFPQVPQDWSVERTVQFMNYSPEVISLSLQENQYTGGAHPNSHLTYANLRPLDGTLFKLSDVLIPGYESKLTAIAEKKFREANQIASQANLNEAGYFFKGGKFYLNENFSIGPKSLIFYYNPYEIAPYAVGPITLSLDYSEIKDLLRPDFRG